MTRNITPEAPSKANAITTCLIKSFPFFACPSLAHSIDINTPPMIIAIKQKINITVITIFVNPASKRGNALVGSVIDVVLEEELLFNAIQFHTKGTLVFNTIPPIALQAQRSAGHHQVVHDWYFSLHFASLSVSPAKATEQAATVGKQTLDPVFNIDQLEQTVTTNHVVVDAWDQLCPNTVQRKNKANKINTNFFISKREK